MGSGTDAYIRNSVPQKVQLSLADNGFEAASAACTSEGRQLCRSTRVCPEGALSVPFGGAVGGAAWLAVSDIKHKWLSIGDVDASSSLCSLDGDWGTTTEPPGAARSTFALCCTGTDDLCFRVDWEAPCPTGMELDGKSDVTCTAPGDHRIAGNTLAQIEQVRKLLATPELKKQWGDSNNKEWPLVPTPCTHGIVATPPPPAPLVEQPAINQLVEQQCSVPEQNVNYRGNLIKKVNHTVTELSVPLSLTLSTEASSAASESHCLFLRASSLIHCFTFHACLLGPFCLTMHAATWSQPRLLLMDTLSGDLSTINSVSSPGTHTVS